MSHHQLDARRLLCPMPVIRTQNLVKTLEMDDTIEVFCSDPGALHDIPAWCRIHGHTLISAERINGEIVVQLRVGHTDKKKNS